MAETTHSASFHCNLCVREGEFEGMCAVVERTIEAQNLVGAKIISSGGEAQKLHQK